MHVYIVSAYNEYESCNIVAGFATKGGADTFSKRCSEADRRKPQCPELHDPEEKWDRYYGALARWEKRHPAKSQNGATSYPVERVKIRSSRFVDKL